MKKHTVIALAAIIPLVYSIGALAVDGTVNFSGSIVDTACTVTHNTANPLSVTLGNISKTAFTGAGSRAGVSRFSLELTDCPESVSQASVQFDGTTANGDNSILALTSGGAEGVGIQLYDDTDNVLPLFTASKIYVLQPVVKNSLVFTARYIATSANVVAGPANSTANFSITYN